MHLSLYCKCSKRVTQGLRVRGSWRPNKDWNILTPTLVAVSVVSFSFSRDAQLEAQGPSSLLDDGFLYWILSPTGLQNSIGGPEGPFGRVWLSLPHLVSNFVRSLTHQGLQGLSLPGYSSNCLTSCLDWVI